VNCVTNLKTDKNVVKDATCEPGYENAVYHAGEILRVQDVE